MIPPEAAGKLLLLVQASDEDGTWSAGLLRASTGNLRAAGNRNFKRALSARGRTAVHWLHHRAPLQDNALIRLPERDVAVIFALPSGQQRVSELFRRAQRMRVSRTVVATVAMQDDYMKRVRPPQDAGLGVEPGGLGFIASDAGLDLDLTERIELAAVLGVGVKLPGVATVERLGGVRARDPDLRVRGAVAVKVVLVVGPPGGG